MKWIDGKEMNIKQMTGKELCKKLSDDLYNFDRDIWLKSNDLIKTAAFILDFDAGLAMDGILNFLENQTEYHAETIKAFQVIGDETDANLLIEICSFAQDEELSEEAIEKIDELESQLYLYSEFDMWELLFDYLDKQIKLL